MVASVKIIDKNNKIGPSAKAKDTQKIVVGITLKKPNCHQPVRPLS